MVTVHIEYKSGYSVVEGRVWGNHKQGRNVENEVDKYLLRNEPKSTQAKVPPASFRTFFLVPPPIWALLAAPRPHLHVLPALTQTHVSHFMFVCTPCAVQAPFCAFCHFAVYPGNHLYPLTELFLIPFIIQRCGVPQCGCSVISSTTLQRVDV